jgi:hypothetical protein
MLRPICFLASERTSRMSAILNPSWSGEVMVWPPDLDDVGAPREDHVWDQGDHVGGSLRNSSREVSTCSTFPGVSSQTKPEVARGSSPPGSAPARGSIRPAGPGASRRDAGARLALCMYQRHSCMADHQLSHECDRNQITRPATVSQSPAGDILTGSSYFLAMTTDQRLGVRVPQGASFIADSKH